MPRPGPRPANRRNRSARHGRFVVAAIINKHDAINIKTVRREVRAAPIDGHGSEEKAVQELLREVARAAHIFNSDVDGEGRYTTSLGLGRGREDADAVRAR